MTTPTRSARRSKTSKASPAKAAQQRRRPPKLTGTRSALRGASHITPVDGNVFADLGFPPDEAENLKVRAHLMSEVRQLIDSRGLTQAQAGKLLGVTQPRVSALMRGKIGLFTIDALVNMLAHAGVSVSVSVVPAAA